MDRATLKKAYEEGLTPRKLIESIKETMAKHASNPIWIHVLSDAELEPYLARLEIAEAKNLPLYGIPFAVKDNIDLAGIPTTAACPDFSYIPESSAYAVERLIKAGAIPIGKTNLDQFATGLVGTRSPYGACQNSIDARYISGGSSSGSAVSVALDMVVFSLGTDTAGSGRVPAAFNELVGFKPSKGVVSTSGVVPACRSLDCVSLFCQKAEDATFIFNVMADFDAKDVYARALPNAMRDIPKSFHFGLPKEEDLAFFGDEDAVFDFPFPLVFGVIEFPALQVLAIEQQLPPVRFFLVGQGVERRFGEIRRRDGGRLGIGRGAGGQQQE